MQKIMQLKNKKGFTLIEMLVVILIIVILIAIAIPAVAGYRADANETADKGAAETIFNALEAASTKYPPNEEENRDGGVYVVNTTGGTIRSGKTLEISNPTDMAGPFLEAVQEFLGTNVNGTFRFQVEIATGSVTWVTYVREGADKTSRANTMLYHAHDGVIGYMDEALDPNDPNDLYDKAYKMHE